MLLQRSVDLQVEENWNVPTTTQAIQHGLSSSVVAVATKASTKGKAHH
jgi:hypothetical protein